MREVNTPEGNLVILVILICVRHRGVWDLGMEDSNYDSHILDVER